MLKVVKRRMESFPDKCKRSGTQCEGRVFETHLKSSKDLLDPPQKTKERSFDLVLLQNDAFRRFDVIPDTERDIRELVLTNAELKDCN
jgi:hypothetical protein